MCFHCYLNERICLGCFFFSFGACFLKTFTMYHMFIVISLKHMSLVMKKPAFSICENKGADQLRGNNREADQPLCFRYTDNTIPLLPKYEISSLWPSSVAVQSGLCGTWSETPKTGFLTTRLLYLHQFSHSSSFASGTEL